MRPEDWQDAGTSSWDPTLEPPEEADSTTLQEVLESAQPQTSRHVQAKFASTSVASSLVFSEVSDWALPQQSTSAMKPSRPKPKPQTSSNLVSHQSRRNSNRNRLCFLYPYPISLNSVVNTSVKRMADKILRFAAMHLTIDEYSLRCPDCLLLPSNPVSGKCGHTRCYKCVRNNQLELEWDGTVKRCPCGNVEFDVSQVNVLAKDILEKLLQTEKKIRAYIKQTFESQSLKDSSDMLNISEYYGVSVEHLEEHRLADTSSRIPISPQIRYNYSFELVESTRYLEASCELAKVAVSTNNVLSRKARKVLEQLLSYMTRGKFCDTTKNVICGLLSSQATKSWLKPSDLECVLCFETFTKPITTPCGHTYCQTCIERSVDYNLPCPLCKRSLRGFNLRSMCSINMIDTVLTSIGAVKPDIVPDPNVIPLCVCTVAFPGVSCSLFIFNRRHWLMVRRIIETEPRYFGMIPTEMQPNSCYGTILEVRDCLLLEDGSYILSTIGVSRFKMIEKNVCDGYDTARIEVISDIVTEMSLLPELNVLAEEISTKFTTWLTSMPRNLVTEILSSYGTITTVDSDVDTWSATDGPTWHWWIITILPLSHEVKVLMLSSTSLHKRLIAISRTLSTILQSLEATTEADKRTHQDLIVS
ncbi:LON peptidase N-terminal domain and RING finger protein 2 isoform X2 [Galleria mellonella]|nr:LON peptidase N-terminal domain and RING finger protein 2 isoform X2 [Galleria mellonella]